MIETESSQDFVLDLLDEIIDSTVQVIHNKYIQSQLQPYSVHAAKDLLLQIIEVKYSNIVNNWLNKCTSISPPEKSAAPWKPHNPLFF